MNKVLPISIVIPSKNDAKNLNRLLSDLSKQMYKPEEIIVADANSDDNTREIARSFNVKVVNGGIPSVGRNNGAKISSQEYVLFLDADVQISSKTFLRDLLEKLQYKELDCATCYFNPNSEFSSISGKIFTWIVNRIKDLSSKSPGVRFKFEWGILIFVKKSVLFDIGGFREDMRYLEDSQFIRDIVNKRYVYSVVKEYIDVDLTRELKGTLKSRIRLFYSALFGIISLNTNNHRLRDNIYDKAKQLYESSRIK